MKPTGDPFTRLMPIQTIDGIVYLDFADVIWLKSECKTTIIYTNTEEKAVRSSLGISEIETMLPEKFFFKCHRCHIISLRHLKKFEKATRQILLTSNHSVTIAEERIPEFLKLTNPGDGKNK